MVEKAMDLFKTVDPDFGEDFSDDHCSAESSEDEIDIILHGTPEQKRKLYQKSKKKSDSSSEDEFEKEMNKELQQTVEALECKRITGLTEDTTQKGENVGTEKNEVQQFYDDIYFDSDEEDKKGEKQQKSKHCVISNDDLLYDPDMDDEDQQWVDKQRKEYQPKSTSKKNNLPRTDAMLNCPACMTTLCRDCQRHEKYPNQFRAMFVSNCDVNISETLKYPKEQEKKKRKRRNKTKEDNPESESSSHVEDEDIYHPVKCSECQTVVAVYDKDEIYYFFNVLTSYS